MTDLDCEDIHLFGDLVVFVHEQLTHWIGWTRVGRTDALDWLDMNLLAELKSFGRVTLCKM